MDKPAFNQSLSNYSQTSVFRLLWMPYRTGLFLTGVRYVIRGIQGSIRIKIMVKQIVLSIFYISGQVNQRNRYWYSTGFENNQMVKYELHRHNFNNLSIRVELEVCWHKQKSQHDVVPLIKYHWYTINDTKAQVQKYHVFYNRKIYFI